jgi:diguanylate cyclase (GGDEF)-like protein
MSRVVEHLAELTAFRDRDALDASLVGAFKDLLNADRLAIHRCVGEAGEQRWITRARLVRGDRVASADPAWVEMATLPELAAFPERLACLQSRETVVVPGTPTVTCFPLATDIEAHGVLQIDTAQPLAVEDLRLVASILRIYRNFEGLLDYSERDTLTGLLNRKTFDDSFLRLNAARAQPAEPAELDGPAAQRSSPAPPAADALYDAAGQRRPPAEGSLWLGVIDIDHFKRVNDGYGHLIGDEVLLLLSRLMRSSFRFQDPLYRFGGEEFVVLMRCAAGADATLAFERLRANVEAHTFPQVGRITISAGFTQLRPHDTPATAFDRADKAVYYAKQHGRNQVRHHAELLAQGLLADDARQSDIELF